MADEKPEKYEPPTKPKVAENTQQDQPKQPTVPLAQPQPAAEPAQAQQQQDPKQEFHDYFKEESPWQAAQEEDFVDQAGSAPVPPVNAVNWRAAEYIDHVKTPMWYGMFIGATIAVTGGVYLLTSEVVASILILVAGISVVFFASRPPSEKNYEISSEGVKVDHKTYDIEEFKSFSVVEEGHKDSIWLKPVKKFAPFLIIYFHQEDEQRIADTLSTLLPHEPRELDNIDKFTRKLKF